MQEFFDVLQVCPLFTGIDRLDWEGMLACLGAHVTRAKKNQVILSEGDPAKYVGIVLSGSVQIVKVDYYGNRSIVARAEPGELFAESFACAGAAELPVSAVADTETAVMLIDCKRILTSCSNACAFHTRMIHNLLRVVALKNLQLNQKIEVTAKRTTREKLMAYLVSQAKQQGTDSFQIPFDRQALADYLQVERSAMSAELGKLRREGVLESKKNQFRLLRELEQSYRNDPHPVT